MHLFDRILVKVKNYLDYLQHERQMDAVCESLGCQRNQIFFMPPFSLSGGQYITIKGSFSAGAGLRMECIDKYGNESFHPHLTIGNKCVMNQNCHVGVINSVIIGNNVLIGSRVLITDHAHGQLCEEEKDLSYISRPLFCKGPVIIHDNVWLGDNVCVLSGVSIGEGTIIGANSVVTHDIPAYCLAAGSPAKIIRKL